MTLQFERDPRFHEVGPMTRWKPHELVTWENGVYVFRYGFEYRFAGWRDGPMGYKDRVEHKLFYHARERVIRDGMANLLNEVGTVPTCPLPPVVATIVPSKLIKKPILLMPLMDGYDLIANVIRAGRFIDQNKVEWEEFV
jgi:hypothetical protein